MDARTGIPGTLAPMSHGPSFPPLKELVIEFGNQTQWPTNKPLFFGTCDDDADTTIAGVVKTMTLDEYQIEQRKENDTRSMQVRKHRDNLLRDQVDSLNPIRWASLSPEQQIAWQVYRQALLDVPSQAGFPWVIEWPVQPTETI